MDQVERVKQICKQRGIAIAKLERECAFSNGYIRGLREGRLPADRLYKIAEYLDVSPEYILTGKEPTPYYDKIETAEIAEELFKNEDIRALLSAAQGLPPEVLRSTADLLTRLRGTNNEG